ncbi:TPA: hypothetical protein N0F65_005164 [Lagenidium giganteum]|uniref:Uncharacterized protein n=1 Tax=Lagenidium giganteum TaxID=4803 RepID=A0AAV2YWF8_9STRA|nr:TPA: hypothetical protein N0F65_005164 [Lagenidium giganteum]
MRGGEMEMENGPTFEDLAIDDSLTDMERVAKYVCSNIALQRVIHVKMLEDTANSVGFETTCDQLIPLLEPLVCDVEYVVRQHVAFQFPPRLMSDPQHEVRSAASDSLVEMAALVKSEDQGQHVLTIVLPLAHEDDNEQFRISAVSLYNGLAEHLGPELCQQFCVPELISLSEDPVFRVRKFTAQSFSNVCKTAGQELSRERLLPAFLRLAKDDIWGVRKACAESLVGISEALAPEDRGELLVPLFESFVNDSSRWVRIAAFQNLGPFLATLERQDVTDALLEHFLNMASSSSAQFGASGEVEIKYHCAFSFPAIVSILGESGWSKISATFEALSNDAFWKIRRTFAHSLHELAKILGQEITEKHLATAFDGYLHDVHDVKLGAMLHFADFLQALSPSFRESYLPVLSEFDSFDQITKWRFREVLCVQLDQLCLTFTPEATFSVVYPLVFKLITDDVAAVRRESFHACPLLLARLQSKPEWVEDVINKFCSLAKSTRYTDRQIYVKVCDAFLSSPEEDSRAVFAKHLATAFFALSADPVSNVRQMFAVEILKHRGMLDDPRNCFGVTCLTLICS